MKQWQTVSFPQWFVHLLWQNHIPTPPPPLQKKNGCNGGDRKFLLEIKGKTRNGQGGYNGGGEILKVFLQSWQRVLTPYFMNTHLYYLPPILPCHLQPSLLLFFLLSCFFGWMSDHAIFGMLFYLILIWIYTCRALLS